MKKENRSERRKNKNGRAGIRALEPLQIGPITNNQKVAFRSWEEGQDLFLMGYAGTGKTFLATYLAVTTGLKVYIVRSAVPTRDMGFLPGNAKEKAAMYEGPYIDACSKVFGRGDAYDVLTQKGAVEFVTTSYLRGITMDDCVVIADEIQNFTFHELDTLITRAGTNCRMVFLGDVTQTDFTKDSDKAGLLKFVSIMKEVHGFDFVYFGISDIVRSDRVRDYIIAKDRFLSGETPVAV